VKWKKANNGEKHIEKDLKKKITEKKKTKWENSTQ
jgi:hypothetical protein